MEPDLRDRGFAGRSGHLVRRTGRGVTEVIEIQHAVFGGRVTVNLGLELDCLKPLVRWLARPAVGPRAHESTRWTRIGSVLPEAVDRWWSFARTVPDASGVVIQQLRAAVLERGLAWLETERDPGAFLAFARERVARSRTEAHPEGSYLDLRLLAVVRAWRGEVAEARRVAAAARPLWPETRARLEAARTEYRKRQRGLGRRLPPVPDLQAELEGLIATTTAVRSSGEGARPRRSRSGRLRSSPA